MEKTLQELAGRIETLHKSLAKAPQEDLGKLREENAAKAAERRGFQERQKTLHARLEKNRGTLAELQKEAARLAEAEKRYTWLKALAETLTGQISGKEKVMLEIAKEFHPDKLFIEDGIALVTVVGEGISTNVGVAANVLRIISEAGINVKMIDAGCSELNIIIGVSESDYIKTIKALYAGLYQYL